MEQSEDLKAAREVVQAILKGKKMLRMYPPNNPIYVKTLEDCFAKFTAYFYFKDSLPFYIRQNDILYDGNEVYANPEKEDNIALFFFKDGVRELTFRKGLLVEEMEDFLKIIALDFERDIMDDDVVTLFWERDFQNIHYVVDETILADVDDDYEETAVRQATEEKNEEDNLLKAYEDAFKEEQTVSEVAIVPLTDKDLQALLHVIEREAQSKIGKLSDILFEMLYLSEKREDFDELTNLFMSNLEYSLRHGEIQIANGTLARLLELIADPKVPDEIKQYLRKVVYFAGSEPMIDQLGEILDSGQETDDKYYEDFFKLLDKNAILPLMKILGELESIHARKVVIDALILLGPKDMVTLAKGLSDSRWYVVRNIIYILRKIADKRAVDYLLKTVRHSDVRVKKEVLRTLGELGGGGVFQVLRECLDDGELQVRVTALKALGTVGSEAAKRTIMDRISSKEFRDKEFEEKKEFFDVLARWKGADVYSFLVEQVKHRTFFGRSKTDENRACAVQALGVLGNKDALPVIDRLKNDGNKLVREYAVSVMKRLDHDAE